MIARLEPPQYQVESMDVSASPDLGQVVEGHVDIDLEMHSPELSADPEGFVCRSRMDLELHYGTFPWQRHETQSSFGEVAVETVIFVPGPRSTLEEFHDQWTEGSYVDVDDEFIDHLESRLLSRVMVPIAGVFDDAFEGIVPRMRFTRVPLSEDDE